MSTPLYKRMKNGSSFYTFPSSSMHPNPAFTKFVLLNIPDKIEGKRLDFDMDSLAMGIVDRQFDIYTDNVGSSSYSEQLVESLRNYVANHDETMRNSRISSTKDFYNIKEKQTPTEMIFWKWLKKMNVIEFQVAQNKIDWDKNLIDFNNSNADTLTNTDYFRKYLWKEREVTDYAIETIIGGGLTTFNGVSYNDTVELVISYNAIFKIGDEVLFTKKLDAIETGTKYPIFNVEYIPQGLIIETHVYMNVPNFTTNEFQTNLPSVKLSYNRLVQYIGEVNMKSDVRTARKDETEIIAYIPHQAGKTPSVLFQSRFDSNYYPGLELPILPAQIQTEILGAENLDSPIRKNPLDYPGTYNGQFDTSNKTYEASNGDKFRYSGEYYGILRNNNIGLSDDSYVEHLSEFDPKYLDGINIDFNLNHYYKMSLTDIQVGFNFDEFNQIVIDGVPPQNFEYNAILWYYDVPGDTINDTAIYTNLYGITFLNNPDNSTTYLYNPLTDKNEIDLTQIDTYKKLVSNNEQDGLSYIHTLNIMTSVDNDITSLSFDPLTINNSFGFEIYQNVMTNVAKLNESYLNMINSFITMNTELNNVKSLVYTQTDIDTIKSKLQNMDSLLKLYSKYQFVDSETVSITPNYADTYPTLSFNVKSSEYSSIYNLTTKDLFDERISSGMGYKITVPDSNKLFIKITNNDVTNYDSASILLDSDLKYKQSTEIIVDVNKAYYSNLLNVYINYYNDAVGYSQSTLLKKASNYLPTDIGNYLTDNVTYSKVFYNNNSISQVIKLVDSIGTTAVPYTVLYTSNQNCFGSADYEESVYIDNFKFIAPGGDPEAPLDYSGVYKIGKTDNNFNQVYFKISLPTFNLIPVGTPVAYLVKGIKYTITRIDATNTSSIDDRYLIEKTYV